MITLRRAARLLASVLATVLPVIGVAFLCSLLVEAGRRQLDWKDAAFWLIILWDMLPTLLALVLVPVFAAQFAKTLYGLATMSEAWGFVNRRFFGSTGFRPFLAVEAGTITGGRDHALTRVGGPGFLMIHSDSAVLLKKAGRLSRLVGSGIVQLEPFEEVYQVIDLRPQRWVHSVPSMTKEGIPVTCDVDIEYQIDMETRESREEGQYPASEETIFRAATCTWAREADHPSESRAIDWAGQLIVIETEEILRTIVARYTLDRLVGLDNTEDRNAPEEIQQDLERKLKASVPRLGAQILQVKIGEITVADKVTKQWIEAWSASWERWSTERLGLGRALQIELLGAAKTRAQIELLGAIAEGFRPLDAAGQNIMTEAFLSRLLLALSKVSAQDASTRIFVSREALDAFQLLRDIAD